MKRVFVLIFAVMLLASFQVFSAGSQEGDSRVKRIAVVTPYMANATTAYVIDRFKTELAEKDWKVKVSDTAGDFGMVVSRIEDAMALGMGDPAQMTKGLATAKAAGVPVSGLDAGLAEGVILNITSDNANLGKQTARMLAESIGGEGDVVMYTHDPHPGVRARAAGAIEVFDGYPGITVVNKFHIDVPGPVDNARKITEDVLTADSSAESVKAIWAGWDEPAYGAVQALEAGGRVDVKVVGIDGTDFAKAEIDKGGPIVGTIEQDFDAMAVQLSGLIESYLNGEELQGDWFQVPGKLYN